MTEKKPNEYGFVCDVITSTGMKRAFTGQELPYAVSSYRGSVLRVTLPSEGEKHPAYAAFLNMATEKGDEVRSKLLIAPRKTHGSPEVAYFRADNALLDALAKARMATWDEVETLGVGGKRGVNPVVEAEQVNKNITCRLVPHTMAEEMSADAGVPPHPINKKYFGNLIEIVTAKGTAAESQFKEFLQVRIPGEPSKTVAQKQFTAFDAMNEDGKPVHKAYFLPSIEMYTVMESHGIGDPFEVRQLARELRQELRTPRERR